MRKDSRNKADRLERFEQYYRKTPEMLDNNGPRPISLLFFSLLYPYLLVDHAFSSHFFANQKEGDTPRFLFLSSPLLVIGHPNLRNPIYGMAEEVPDILQIFKTVYISIHNRWFILEE